MSVPALHLPAPAPPTPPSNYATTYSSLPTNSSLMATANTSIAAASTAHAVPTHATTATPSALLKAHTNSMGVFSTYKSQAEIADSLKLASAQRHIDQVNEKYAKAQGESEILKAQFEDEKRIQDGIQTELNSLEYDLAHTVPLIKNMLERRTKAYTLQQNIEGMQEKIRLQQEVVQRTRQRFEQKDLEKDKYQYELQQLDSLQTLLNQKKEEESFQSSLLSQATSQHHAAARARQLRKQQRLDEATRAEEAAQAQKDLAEHLRAEEFRQQHANQIAEVSKLVEAREAALDQLRDEAIGRRKDNVLQLKASTELAQNNLIAANAKRAKQLAYREHLRQKEREALDAAGKNADAIFVARDEEERMKNKAKRIAAEQVIRGERLKVQMALESTIIAKEELAKVKEDYIEADYKRKMGRSVIDVKAAEMADRKRRKEEKERNDQAMLVRQLENKRFVPEDVSEPSDDDQEEEKVQPPSSSINVSLQKILPQHQHAAAPDQDSSDDEFASGGPPPDEKILSPSQLKQIYKSEHRIPDAEYNAWGLRVIPNHANAYRAKLDARKIALALAAQKKKLAEGVPKVVCGKAYENSSKFLSDPPSIIFKDFSVGQEMTQTITITNVSFSFNHFKILNLADEYLDFFEIIYTPVGRMSAGSIAKVKIVFRPKVNEDIHTVLPLLAETGPFSIPLICLTKKACISIQPDPILDMGVTVLGDSSSAYFTIKNNGAVPVDFVVVPMMKQRTPEQLAIFEERKRLAAIGIDYNQQQTEEKEQDANEQLFSSTSASLSDVKPLNLTGLVPASAVVAEPEPVEPVHPSLSPRPHSNHAVLVDPSQISLPPDWHRSDEDEQLVNQIHQDQLQYEMDYLEFPTTGRVEAYSETKWELKFAPIVDGAWVHTFQLRFGPQVYARNQRLIQWDSPKDFDLQVCGEGTKVPIYIENDLLDFQTICYGKLYRSEIVLRNRHGTAHMINVHYPSHLKALADYIEFLPKVGYIQGFDTLKVQVKVTPALEMWRILREITLDSSNGCINEAQYDIGHIHIPFSIEVKDQTLPVLWSMTGRLVEPALKLSVRSLNFGQVFTSESKTLPILFTNQSPIIQKFSSVHLPPEIRLEPYEGQVTIPPFRSMELNVIFSPSSSIDYSFPIQFRTKLGEDIKIPIIGVGKKPKIKLLHSNIHFQATPNFNQSFQENYISNLSKIWKHTVEFILDEPQESKKRANSIHSQKSFLSIFPHTIQLEPLKPSKGPISTIPPSSPKSPKRGPKLPTVTSEARIDIEFKPMLNLDQLYENVGLQASDINEEDADGKVEEMKIEEEKTATSSIKSPKSTAPVIPTPASPPAGTKRSQKKAAQAKLTAEAAAELARKQAEEEAERARIEAERLAREEAAALEKRLEAQEEVPPREMRDERQRIQSINDRPERHWMEFSDRLQLQTITHEQVTPRPTHDADDEDGDEARDEFGSSDDLQLNAEEGDTFHTNAPSTRSVTKTISEPFSRHARHRVAVHIKSEHTRTGAIEYDVMFMELQTTLILPVLEVKPPIIDFGQIPLGRSCIKSFEVRNTSTTQTIQLSMDTLGYSSNFQVMNALRVVKPGEIQIIVVQFKPRLEGKESKQDLILRSEEHPNIQVTVPLVGLCISPNLQIILPTDSTADASRIKNWEATPNQLQLQLLHLGDCVVNDPITRTFTVKNLSIYPYAFTLTHHPVLDGSGVHAQVHGASTSLTTTSHNIQTGAPPEFYFVPSQGLIPPNGGTMQITVHFTPTTPTYFFPYQTIVEVGNQRLKVQAEVHERQLFIQGGRQVLVNDTQGHLSEPALQDQIQSSAFQNKSLVTGWTNMTQELIYQNPLAFLDGPTVIGQSVGGGSVAAQYPALMTSDPWDRVLLDEASFATSSSLRANENDKTGKKSNKKKLGEKKDSNSSTSGSTSASDNTDKRDSTSRGRTTTGPLTTVSSEPLDPTAIANRMIELTFDTTQLVDLATIQASLAAANPTPKGKPGKDRSAADPTSAPTYVLVETIQIGNAVMSHSVITEPTAKSVDKDSIGTYEISMSSTNMNEKEKKVSSTTSSSAPSSTLDADSLLQLFTVEPNSGSLRVGSKDKIYFLFDWTKYQLFKAADAERRVLSVGQWLECYARIQLKGGLVPAHGTNQQTIEVKLRVYVD